MKVPEISLRRVPVAEAAAMVRGDQPPEPGPRWHPEYPMSDTFSAIAMLQRAYEHSGVTDVAEPHWWIHQMVLDGEVVGDCGFHGPPAVDERPVAVEVGYNVVPAMRRRGIGRRACALLLDLAWSQGADVVTAETEVDNVASQNVLLGNGFGFVGPGEYVIVNPHAGGRG